MVGVVSGSGMGPKGFGAYKDMEYHKGRVDPHSGFCVITLVSYTRVFGVLPAWVFLPMDLDFQAACVDGNLEVLSDAEFIVIE